MSRRILPVLLLPLLILLSACSDDGGDAAAAGVSIQGTDGVTVTLAETPERIVSLAPHATEIICALGAGERLAAVDRYENCPAGSGAKPELDGFQPSVEAIVAHEPDLVYMVFDPGDIAQALRGVGITTLVLDVAADIDGVFTNIEQIGRITGAESEAEELIADMRGQRDDVLSRIEGRGEAPTYFHELDNTYFTVRSDTFVGSLYSVLGAENIADAAESQYPQLSSEAIVAADADVIVLVDGESPEAVADRPGWDTIAAVENGRICELDGDLLSRPGPRIMQGLESLAECLYPEE